MQLIATHSNQRYLLQPVFVMSRRLYPRLLPHFPVRDNPFRLLLSCPEGSNPAFCHRFLQEITSSACFCHVPEAETYLIATLSSQGYPLPLAFVISRRHEPTLLPHITASHNPLCKPRLVTITHIIIPESKDSTLGAALWRPGSLWLRYSYVLQSLRGGACMVPPRLLRSDQDPI